MKKMNEECDEEKPFVNSRSFFYRKVCCLLCCIVFFYSLSLYKEFREHRVGFYYIHSMSTRESVQPIYEMGCSLAHWSSGPILSPTYSWPAVWPTHTHVLVHTHGTPSVPHCGGEDSGKWGQRSCVVIHLSSVTAAANKSLIHGLIHRLSSAQTGNNAPVTLSVSFQTKIL